MTTLVASMSDFVFRQPPTDADSDNPLRYVNMVPVHPRYEDFSKRFNVKVTSGYGQSEAVKILSYGWHIDDPRGCGRPQEGWPGIQLRIVDEHDYEVPVGGVGELIVRSDTPWTLNLGYFHDPAATAEAWRNGWFHTGDMFRQDENGVFYFVDRARDAIRRRGVNISSSDVEAEVNAHPEVLECAAVAVQTADGEEELLEQEIKVYVVLRERSTLTPADLITFLEQNAPQYMVPRFIEFIDALPRNESQRVQKFQLRAGNGMGTTRSVSDAGRTPRLP
jgi:crotonobetaine/carnitine-CoA ligase